VKSLRNYSIILVLLLLGCRRESGRIKRAEYYMKMLEPLKALSVLAEDSSAVNLTMMAKINFKIDHPMQAIPIIEKLVKCGPSYQEKGIKMLSDYAERAKKTYRDYVAAICLLKILEIDPEYDLGEDYGFLGNWFYNREDYEKAIEFYNKFLMEDSSAIQIRLKLAQSYEKTGDYGDAYQVLDAGNEISKDWDIKYNLGKISFMLGKEYFNNGNVAKAEELFRRTIRLGLPEVLVDDAYFYLGDIYFSEGKYSRAIEYYRKVEDLNPFSSNRIVRKAKKRIDVCKKLYRGEKQ